MSVRIIPAYRKKDTVIEKEQLRVAAYCRVSTDMEEQESSYEAQVTHYTDLIERTPSWTLAGIYSDEGITGTSTAKREGFQKMIKDCEKGKIDYVVTKSISRFARNTLDTLENIRKLKELGIPIFFEKENINTITSSGELLITILASIAQQESQSISLNVGMGIRYRFQAGKPMLNHTRFLGYTKNRGENLQIVEEEARIIQYIYRGYLEGMSISEIIEWLGVKQIKTVSGNEKWSYSAIRSILNNEKYMGDLLLQKSYTVDFLTKKRRKNKGNLPQYYVKNNHEGIVPRDVFYYIQGLMSSRRSSKRRMRTILHGLVVCGDCGSKYRRFNDKNYGVTWRCTGRYGEKRCKGPSAHESVIKGAVIAAFNKLPEYKDELYKRRNELNDQLGTDLMIRIDMIERQIERIENAAEYASGGDSNSPEKKGVENLNENHTAAAELRGHIKELRSEQDAYLSEKGQIAMKLAQIQSLVRFIDAIEGKSTETVLKTGSCTDIVDFYTRTDLITQHGPVHEFEDLMVRRFVETIIIRQKSIAIKFKTGITIETI